MVWWPTSEKNSLKVIQSIYHMVNFLKIAFKKARHCPRENKLYKCNRKDAWHTVAWKHSYVMFIK